MADKFKDLDKLKEKLKRAVEIYNNQIPHMSCHLLTPNQMHNQQKLKVVKWRKNKAGKTVNKE